MGPPTSPTPVQKQRSAPRAFRLGRECKEGRGQPLGHVAFYKSRVWISDRMQISTDKKAKQPIKGGLTSRFKAKGQDYELKMRRNWGWGQGHPGVCGWENELLSISYFGQYTEMFQRCINKGGGQNNLPKYAMVVCWIVYAMLCVGWQ